MRIDIEDIRQIQDEIKRINSLDLNDVELYVADERTIIKQEIIDEWEFIGLNNYHFFADAFYDR